MFVIGLNSLFVTKTALGTVIESVSSYLFCGRYALFDVGPLTIKLPRYQICGTNAVKDKPTDLEKEQQNTGLLSNHIPTLETFRNSPCSPAWG